MELQEQPEGVREQNGIQGETERRLIFPGDGLGIFET